jgi:hypothetical protein
MGAGLGLSELGDGLEFFAPAPGEVGKFVSLRVEGGGFLAEQFLLFAQRPFFFDHALELAVDERFAFREAPFGFVMVGASLNEGSFGRLAQLKGVLAGFGASFAGNGVGFAAGAFDKGLLFNATGGAEVSLLPSKQPVTGKGAAKESGHSHQSGVIQQIHFRTARGLLSDANAWVSECNPNERHAAPK